MKHRRRQTGMGLLRSTFKPDNQVIDQPIDLIGSRSLVLDVLVLIDDVDIACSERPLFSSASSFFMAIP
jgi:hypothetical protein